MAVRNQIDRTCRVDECETPREDVELEARDDVDEHLRDVIEGLQLRADDLEETLDDDQGEA